MVNCWLKREIRPVAKHLIDAVDHVIEEASKLGIDLNRTVNGEVSDKITKIRYLDQSDNKPLSELAVSTCDDSKVIFTCHENPDSIKIKVFRKKNDDPPAYNNFSYN